jgi:hypothetical protein
LSELALQLLPKFLRQRWTLPCRGNRNLKISALHQRGIIKFAKVWHIHHIAKNSTPLRFAVNKFVDRSRSRRHHRKKNFIQVAR